MMIKCHIVSNCRGYNLFPKSMQVSEIFTVLIGASLSEPHLVATAAALSVYIYIYIYIAIYIYKRMINY